MSGFFSTVKQAPVKTANGTCELPILYRDASQFGVFFRIDLDRACELMAGLEIEPWPIFGKAMGAIYVWEYRDSTVGSYNEVGLGIQARRRGSKPSLAGFLRDMRKQDDQGIWVVNLPVTTQSAYEAGVDLWGYPKYVTPIHTTFREESAHCRLADEIELSVGKLRGPSMLLPVVTYTSKGKRLIRTVIEVEQAVKWGMGRSASLRVIGDGPTAQSVRALGMESLQPAAVFRTERFRAILPAGADIGPSHSHQGL